MKETAPNNIETTVPSAIYYAVREAEGSDGYALSVCFRSRLVPPVMKISTPIWRAWTTNRSNQSSMAEALRELKKRFDPFSADSFVKPLQDLVFSGL